MGTVSVYVYPMYVWFPSLFIFSYFTFFVDVGAASSPISLFKLFLSRCLFQGLPSVFFHPTEITLYV